MYTQCPECNAVLEITAADLAVAGGFARCGQCGKSFDALRSLSDRTPEPGPASSVRPGVVDDADEPPAAADPATAAVVAPADAVDEAAGAAEEPDGPAAATDSAVAADEGSAGHVAAVDGAEENLGEPAAATDSAVAADEDSAGHVAAVVADDDPDSSAAAAATDSAAVRETADEADTGTEPSVAGSAAATEQQETEPDTQHADAEDEDDEILLDESYEPPAVDDDDETFFEDEWDEEPETFTASGVAEDDDEEGLFAGFDDGAEEVDGDAGSVAAADASSAVDDVAEADESALFTLPLPELTPLDRERTGRLPEKMEGGAAAQDPFAQSGQEPRDESISPAAVTTAAPVATAASDAWDAEDARDLRDYLKAPTSRAATIGWSAGAALMALLLIGQIVHRNRGDLVIHPRFGPVVSSIYRGIGVEPRPNWRIADYKVVGQARLFEMPEDETPDSETSALRFVAIISNGANRPQPPPMVRLTLRDRWGDPTGVRDFTPPEYLADRALVGALLEPGQRLRVVLNLHDPGADVVGFDFDMCLPDGAGTLRCAGEG